MSSADGTQGGSLTSRFAELIYLADNGESSFVVQTNAVPAMYIGTDTKIGLNTIYPSTQLEVNSSTGSGICLRYDDSTTSYANIAISSGGDLTLNTHAAGAEITTLGSINLINHNGSTTGLKLGGVLVTTTAAQLNAIGGSIPGTAVASKGLVTDSANSIAGINALSASYLTGTLQTAAQPNITSVGTLTSLAVSGGITGSTLTGTLQTAAQTNITSVGTLTSLAVTNGVSAATLTGTLQTASQPNITSIGALSSVSIAGSTIASEAAYIAGVVPGVAANSKALVLNSSGNVSGIGSLSATSLTGTLQTAAQPNITSVGTLSSLAVTNGVTASTLTGTLQTAAQPNITSVGALTSVSVAGSTIGSEAAFLSGAVAGTAANSKALVLSNVGAIGGIASLTATSLYGTLQTASQPNITSVGALSSVSIAGATIGSEAEFLSGVVAGTAANSKALVLSGAGAISGIASLSATNLTGTLQTTAQPNIASVGTLSTLNVSGATTFTSTTDSTTASTGALVISGGVGIAKALRVGGNVSITGTLTVGGVPITSGGGGGGGDSVYLTGVVPGTAAPFLALVLDEFGDIAGINSLSSTFIRATGSTASSSTATGALVVTGGVGIGGAMNVGGDVAITGTLTVGGVAITSGGGGGTDYTTGVTPGTALPSKSLVLNSLSNISGINSLSSTYLTGTLQTAAQTNITSVGTLSGLTVSGAIDLTGGSAAITCNGAINLTGGSAAITCNGTITLTGGATAFTCPGLATIGSLTISGATSLTSATASSSTTTGALVVTGGVGIGGAMNVGGDVAITGTLTVGGVPITSGGGGGSSGSITGLITGTVTSSSANTINNGLLLKTGYSGTTAAGIGGSLILQSQNGSGTFVNTLQIQSSLTTVTDAAEQSNTSFIVKKSGADYTTFSCSNTGNIMYNDSSSVLQLLKTPFSANGDSTTGSIGLTELTFNQYDSSGSIGTFGRIQCSSTNVSSTNKASKLLFVLPNGNIERTILTVDYTGSSFNGPLTVGSTLTCGGIISAGVGITGYNLVINNPGALLANGVVRTTANDAVRPFVGPITSTVQRNISTSSQYGTNIAWENSFFVKTTYSENYTFSIVAACTYHKMWINGVLLSQNWNTINTTATTYNATSTIPCIANGYVYIYIQYLAQAGGTTTTNVFWQSTSQASGSIPVSAITGASSALMGHFTNGVVAHNNLEIVSSAATSTTAKLRFAVDTSGNATITAPGTCTYNTPLTVASSYLTTLNGGLTVASGTTTLSGGNLAMGGNNIISVGTVTVTAGVYSPAVQVVNSSASKLLVTAAFINTSLQPNYFNYVYSPSVSTTTSTLNYFGFDSSNPLIISGFITPTFTQAYTFYLSAQYAKFRLFLDGKLVLQETSTSNNSALTTYTTAPISCTSTVPIHVVIQMMCYGNSGSNVKLEWSSSSQTRAVISSGFMRSDGFKGIYPTPIAGADLCTIYSTGSGSTPTKVEIAVDSSGNCQILPSGSGVAIGNTTAAHLLELASDSAAKPATSSWTVSSDSRLKDNIHDADLDICYENIKNLRLVRYTWKDDVYTPEQVSDRTKVGWIAQEVEQVIPKAVSSIEAHGLDDCRTLNVDQIYASMYGAIQKLMAKNEDLEARLAVLENK